MTSSKYTKQHIEWIIQQRTNNVPWHEVATLFYAKFGEAATAESLRGAIRYRNLKQELDVEVIDTSLLSEVRSARRISSKRQRQINIVLDEYKTLEDAVQAVDDVVEEIFDRLSITPQAVPLTTNPRKLHGMTLEMQLSDLHYGKMTDSFNYEVARNRMRQISDAIKYEIAIHKDSHHIERLVLNCLGDIIESATMHGVESLMGCEAGNASQVMMAIESLFEDLICPLAVLGTPIFVNCVTGNHDRITKEKTYYNRGQEHMTHIIFHTLRKMCELMEWDHISFEIAQGTYNVLQIYDDLILCEHGDEIGKTKDAMYKRIADRQRQLGVMLYGLRLGHWHEYTMYDRGRVIINGCLPGSDSFSDTLGYDTAALQVLNFYCHSNHRPNSFYKSFPIFLS